MKIYKVLNSLLLTNAFAEENGLPNRWIHAGELLSFPDPSAKRLLEKGEIELYIPPAPPAVEKKVKTKAAPAAKEK